MARLLRRLRDAAILASFFILATLIVAKLEQGPVVTMRGAFTPVDGDTLSTREERLRLEGIDAPELSQICHTATGEPWPCGERARQALGSLISAAPVTCEGSERDRYQRLLVRCRAAGAEINAAMVTSGMAVASGGYAREERQARTQGRGLWAGRFDPPRDWRVTHGVMDDQSMPADALAWLRRWISWD